MVMNVEAFGMTTTEQANKYSKEEMVGFHTGWMVRQCSRRCDGAHQYACAKSHDFCSQSERTLVSTNQMRADVRAQGEFKIFSGIIKLLRN
jgi:3-methyladenine DNA glycosylase AlkD